MKSNLIAKSEITIHASSEKIWQALTDPAMIKEYLFGTDCESDWQEGSSITYRGVWQGKPYEDKGKVIKVIPEMLLETTYWSGIGGLPDLPENYKNVSYALAPVDGGILLTITQDGNKTEEETKHSEGNWNMVLASLKKLVEK